MVEVLKKRRRWQWAVLIAAMLAFAAPVAWRYRPLNAIERRLLGTWEPVQAKVHVNFTSDRRFWGDLTFGGKYAGSWQLSGGTLARFHDRPIRWDWAGVVDKWNNWEVREECNVTFTGENSMTWEWIGGGMRTDFVRVPD